MPCIVKGECVLKSNGTTYIAHVDGMTCMNCKNKIERKLRSTPGIQHVEVSYNNGTVKVVYQPDILSPKNIVAKIESLGYKVTENKQRKTTHVVGLLLIIAALYLFLEHFGILNLFVPVG